MCSSTFCLSWKIWCILRRLLLMLNMCSHGVSLLRTLEVFCRKNFSYKKQTSVCLTDKYVFCKKKLKNLRLIFLLSRFPGKIVMFSTRKNPLKWPEKPPKRCPSNLFSLLATCLILASWQLQNRLFAEHLHWLLLIQYAILYGQRYTLFYKNTLYESIEDEIYEKVKNVLRILSSYIFAK